MSRNINLKKYNTSVLKNTSKDDRNNEYMTECKDINVIDFDSFGKKYFGKKIRGLNIKLKTNDALFLHKDGKYTFIEFKNLDFKVKNNKIDNEKLRELEEKIIGSIYILLDATKMNFEQIAENVNYILVYNKEKNSSFVDIAKMIDKNTGIDFGLEKFKGYCFKEVHTYTQDEFEKEFVKKYEKK